MSVNWLRTLVSKQMRTYNIVVTGFLKVAYNRGTSLQQFAQVLMINSSNLSNSTKSSLAQAQFLCYTVYKLRLEAVPYSFNLSCHTSICECLYICTRKYFCNSYINIFLSNRYLLGVAYNRM